MSRTGSSEAVARTSIDEALAATGWVVQHFQEINLKAGRGVAVREFPTSTGPADYLLFADGKAIGVVEAKKTGTTLSGVAEQSLNYAQAVTPFAQRWTEVLPFTYESTAVETWFCDLRDPHARSRQVFSFHRPETLLAWVQQPDTLRARLQYLPPLITAGLRECQTQALQGLERSLTENRPRALLQMATGSGKTFTAVTACYRLIKHAGARRILFLVDRNNLGRQTLREFQQYVAPDDGRKFGELYNVQHLVGSAIDPVAKVTISTIQRLYSQLMNQPLDAEAEEQSTYEAGSGVILPGEEKEVRYYSRIPIETFDFIIVDECHRSIYNLWRQVLDYFDAFLIGLTATPSKHTLGFFRQNLITEYSHERAVADGVNVGYDIYRIKTAIGEQGSKVKAHYQVERRDRLTRKRRWETLDQELEYKAGELDRSVVAPDQIRKIIQTYRDRLFTELFPGRSTWVPKTLIFAKDDSHAEDIVHIVREEFGRGNEFCKKITYRVSGKSPEDLIKAFRSAPEFRIAVTVDMVSTGTDIRPLEVLIFMRDVKSQVYFEQMKGRGTRTIDPTELQAVTPDTRHKTRFVLIDAVGVTESDKTDSRSLERKRSIALPKLLLRIAQGARDKNTLTTLANRLARLNQALEPAAKKQIQTLAGKTLRGCLVKENRVMSRDFEWRL